jgi:hypothetical protein
MKSGNLNFLEPSWPLQACNGTGLPLLKVIYMAQLLFAYFVTVPYVEAISTLSSARINLVLQDIYSRSDSGQGKRADEVFIYQR